MSRARAYSRSQFIWGVNLAALLGWAAFTVVALYDYVAHYEPSGAAAVLGLLGWAAGIGLPIAFVVCWAAAAPVLWTLMRRPMSWPRTFVWGLLIPGAMSLAAIVATRLWGLRAAIDPSYHFQTGSGDQVQEIDGILTHYGWLLTLRNAMLFMLMGLAVALITRAIVGPGRPPVEAALPPG